jgi:hypothetical protein
METILNGSKRVRTVPNFDIAVASGDVRRGVGYIILFSVFFVPMIVFLESIKDAIFLFLCLSSALLMFLIGGILEIVNGASVLIKKRNWIKNAARTQGIIVNREITSRSAGDQYFYYDEPAYVLEVKYTPIMPADNSTEQIIQTYINQSLYENYEHQGFVILHCDVQDPLVFFIDGE